MHNTIKRKNCLEAEISEEKCRELRIEEFDFLMKNIQNKGDVYLLINGIWEYNSDYPSHKREVQNYAKFALNYLIDNVSSKNDLDPLRKEILIYKNHYKDYNNDEDFLNIKRYFSEVEERERLTREFDFSE
ncbi:hypothetical protein GYA25_01990 [Candidatus Woesearchaeota archaeon]|jgi:Holliday junction resolvase RusA-like endonuclease|nr:hypothetical protein [Candidatus Woesearchaeota archaeon]